jgi:uncharacterized protein (TIGR00730 family)
MAFSVCVYLGSRQGDNPLFTEAAQAVGRWIGRHGGQLVYGGGRSGLMGTVAEATRLAGGRVVGIIPQALVDKELANQLCDELHVVTSMHERKAMMAERSDAFLALPGGIGTLEELFEVWTWRQLGYHDKPVGLLNTGGYYDELLAFLQSSVRHGFMSDWQMGLLRTGTDAQTLLPELVQAAGLTANRVNLSQI